MRRAFVRAALACIAIAFAAAFDGAAAQAPRDGRGAIAAALRHRAA